MPPLLQKYPNARITASSAQRGWPGLVAERLEHPAGRVSPLPATATELTLVLQGSASVWRQLDGARPQRIEAVPGAMWLTPAESREEFIDFQGAISQALHIYLSAELFASVGPALEDHTTVLTGLSRDAPLYDSLVEQIARALCAELQVPAQRSSSLIGPLGLCLAARLLQTHRDARPEGIAEPAGLDARRLARVKQHVSARLDRNLSIDELARVACLSPSRFAHAFKASTGESPQHYVSGRRLELARALLRETDLPLAEVACRCGFSSQSNFTKAFVRATHQTPGRYRQQGADQAAAAARKRSASSVQ